MHWTSNSSEGSAPNGSFRIPGNRTQLNAGSTASYSSSSRPPTAGASGSGSKTALWMPQASGAKSTSSASLKPRQPMDAVQEGRQSMGGVLLLPEARHILDREREEVAASEGRSVSRLSVTSAGSDKGSLQQSDAQKAKSEREYWTAKCMQEVHRLEEDTVDKIKNLEERLQEHDEELKRQLRSAGSERDAQRTALEEMRRDLGVQRDHQHQITELTRSLNNTQAIVAEIAKAQGELANSQGRVVAESPRSEAVAESAAVGARALQDLRTEIDMSRSQQRATTDALSSLESQVTALQAAIRDVRQDFRGQQEALSQNTEATKASLAQLRVEMTDSQTDTVQAVQEAALRSTMDLGLNVRQAAEAAAEAAAESAGLAFRTELRRETESLRQELEAERTRADQQVSSLGRTEAQCMELRQRMEESQRKLEELRQDVRSETVVLGGRVEAQVSEHDELLAKTDALRARLEEEQQRRGTELASLRQHIEKVAEEQRQGPLRQEQLQADVQELATRAERLVESDEYRSREAAALNARLDATEKKVLVLVQPTEEANLRNRVDSLERSYKDIRNTEQAFNDSPQRSDFGEAAQAELASLAARVEVVEASCKAATTAAQNARETPVSSSRLAPNVERQMSTAFIEELPQLRLRLQEMCGNVGSLQEDLAAERRQRLELADLARQAESEVKRATNRMDRVEQKFSDEIRGELTKRIGSVNAVASELCDQLRSELASKMTVMEERLGIAEARAGAVMEVGPRVGRLEGRISEIARMELRLGMLEGEMKRSSNLVASFLEERSSKKMAAMKSINELEADMQTALKIGKQDGMTDTTNVSTGSAKRALSEEDRNLGSTSREMPTGSTIPDILGSSAMSDADAASVVSGSSTRRGSLTDGKEGGTWLTGVRRILTAPRSGATTSSQPDGGTPKDGRAKIINPAGQTTSSASKASGDTSSPSNTRQKAAAAGSGNTDLRNSLEGLMSAVKNTLNQEASPARPSSMHIPIPEEVEMPIEMPRPGENLLPMHDSAASDQGGPGGIAVGGVSGAATAGTPQSGYPVSYSSGMAKRPPSPQRTSSPEGLHNRPLQSSAMGSPRGSMDAPRSSLTSTAVTPGSVAPVAVGSGGVSIGPVHSPLTAAPQTPQVVFAKSGGTNGMPGATISGPSIPQRPNRPDGPAPAPQPQGAAASALQAAAGFRMCGPPGSGGGTSSSAYRCASTTSAPSVYRGGREASADSSSALGGRLPPSNAGRGGCLPGNVVQQRPGVVPTPAMNMRHQL